MSNSTGTSGAFKAEITRRRGLSHVYFGWWTVLALGIVGLLGWGFVSYGFSVFFKPIAADLHLSRAVMSVAASAVSVGNILLGPLGGWASDKYGPKWVILLGLLLMSLGFILVSFASTYLAFILVWGILIGAGWCFACVIPPVKAMINWFTRRSGIAISITFTFSLLSGLVLLPLIAWLITSQGWRHTALIVGIVIAIVGFPLTWFLVKRYRPEHYGLVPDGTPRKTETDINQITDKKEYAHTSGDIELTLKQTLKTRSFWLLMTSVWVSTLAVSIMTVHLVPFLTDMGMSNLKAAGVMSIGLHVRFRPGWLSGFSLTV